MADVFRPMINDERSTYYYYGKVRDPESKKWKKVSLGVTDKGVAREKLRLLQKRAEQTAYGMLDALTGVPLLEHIDKLERHLAQQDRDETYRHQTFHQIAKVALFCAGEEVPRRIEREDVEGLRTKLAKITLSAVTPEKVDEFLGTLPPNSAPRTRNAYRTSIITLFSFLVAKQKLRFNPMLVVTRHQGEQKRKRRALSAEQLQRLLNAAKTRPLANTLLITRGKRKGQQLAVITPQVRESRERDGRRRALIYLSAVYTGLRRKELRALRVKHLRLDGELPSVHLPGAHTKNGKDANIPLPADYARELRTWVSGSLTVTVSPHLLTPVSPKRRTRRTSKLKSGSSPCNAAHTASAVAS